MGCGINVGDKYEKCAYLIDEYKLILCENSAKTYSKNEQKAIDIFLEKQRNEIESLIKEISQKEKNSSRNLRLKGLIKEFQNLITEDSEIID